MILFVNACVREGSRTLRLAKALLKKLQGEVEEVRLIDVDFPKTDEAFLQKRDALIEAGRFDDEIFALARQFAKADTIVIAAPYWDLSFPASLKQYVEHINIHSFTFGYTEDGRPIGLCKAKTLYYVMTSGGTFAPEEYGFGFFCSLAQNYYGIEDVRLIKAVGLDLQGADPEAILAEAEKEI